MTDDWRTLDIANPTDEHSMLREMVRGFVSEEVEPQALEFNRDEKFNTDLFRTLGESGLLGISVPSEYGGGGMDATAVAIINEELSYSDPAFCLAYLAHDQLMVNNLAQNGSHEQKSRILPKVCSGEWIGCMAMSEPDHGTDVMAMETNAIQRDDGNWVINGQKIWTSTAQYSQMMFCLVRTEPDAPKHSGISYLLIPMDTPGIEIRPLVDMTLNAGFNEVFFTDVTIPESHIVGKRGEGWSVANATLSHERGSLSDPNAMMNRLNSLIERMKEETINGQKTIDNPIYRDNLMKIQGKVIAFQSNSLRVLSAKLNKNQNVKIAGMIQKLVGTELRHELEGFALDIMGELGTLYENSPNIRDGGSWQVAYMYFLGLIIGGGTSQIQKNIISERGLGLPKEPKVQQGA